MLPELGIRVPEHQIVVNERVAGHDAEQVDQVFGGGAHVAADRLAVGGGVEDGEIVIGVGVNGMEEAEKADGIGGVPELEDSVDVEEVVEKGSEAVPAFAGTGRA